MCSICPDDPRQRNREVVTPRSYHRAKWATFTGWPTGPIKQSPAWRGNRRWGRRGAWLGLYWPILRVPYRKTGHRQNFFVWFFFAPLAPEAPKSKVQSPIDIYIRYIEWFILCVTSRSGRGSIQASPVQKARSLGRYTSGADANYVHSLNCFLLLWWVFPFRLDADWLFINTWISVSLLGYAIIPTLWQSLDLNMVRTKWNTNSHSVKTSFVILSRYGGTGENIVKIWGTGENVILSRYGGQVGET